MDKQQKVGTKIRIRTAGDDWTIRRIVANVPAGQTLTDAWFTAKANLEDLDAAALFQKHVNAVSDQPGVGFIENSGSGGTATIRFDLVPADTVKFKPWLVYWYDIQVKTSLGKFDTPDDGTIIATPQITQTTM